jgi:hypothetical protein
MDVKDDSTLNKQYLCRMESWMGQPGNAFALPLKTMGIWKVEHILPSVEATVRLPFLANLHKWYSKDRLND